VPPSPTKQSYHFVDPIATMASVTSLDKDMRKLRLDRYTPQAASEVRTFIEDSLGERLANGDLLESLKDGVALCKSVSLDLSLYSLLVNAIH
jgi:hypothetical protein